MAYNVTFLGQTPFPFPSAGLGSTLADVRKFFGQDKGYLAAVPPTPSIYSPDAAGTAAVTYALRVPVKPWPDRITEYGTGIKDVSTWLAGFVTFGFLSSTPNLSPTIVLLLMLALASFLLAISLSLLGRWLAMETVIADQDIALPGGAILTEEWVREPRDRSVVASLMALSGACCILGIGFILWIFFVYFVTKTTLAWSIVSGVIMLIVSLGVILASIIVSRLYTH